MESGREFKAEIEKLVVALDEKQEWTKRIEVMLAQTQLFCCIASLLAPDSLVCTLRNHMLQQVNSSQSYGVCRLMWSLALVPLAFRP